MVPYLLWITCLHYDCSLTAAVLHVNEWPGVIARDFKPNFQAVVMYLSWFLFQLVLYLVLPGCGIFGSTFVGRPVLDKKIPTRLAYKLNGLMAYIFTIVTFLGFSDLGVYPLYKASIVADNIGPLLTVTIIFVCLVWKFLTCEGVLLFHLFIYSR